MKIEEEIKQPLFKDEFQKLVINLKFTAGWLGGFHVRLLKSYGLSAQQFNVLRILRGQYPDPSSLHLIKERMLDKDSNASRLIDKLEAAGLTTRVQCPDDRRQVRYHHLSSRFAIIGKSKSRDRAGNFRNYQLKKRRSRNAKSPS
jgi:DNA-binding MarR family transcriptional regulator